MSRLPLPYALAVLVVLHAPSGHPASAAGSGLRGAPDSGTAGLGDPVQAAPADTAEAAAPGQAASPGTPGAARADSVPDFEVLPDRWRDIPLPPYDLNVKGHWYDPYNQNVLKGDYPIVGQNTFLVLTAQSESFGTLAASPTPSGASTDQPGSDTFFGRGGRFQLSQTFKLSMELYHGDVSFRPRDWEIRVTPVWNGNHAGLDENNNLNINVRKRTSRSDSHLGLQELSLEKHLFDLSRRFDFVSIRLGVQRFGSDFRDLVFRDSNLGVRLFGNAGSNRFQYNAAYFFLLEKDTNSELNIVFEDRRQGVVVANLYAQDLFTKGYTGQISFHMNTDEASRHEDENGVPVRPSLLGVARPHEIRAYYLGWTGDGHLGRLNVSHALYQALGTDDLNPVAGRAVDVNARLGFLELSVDRDWMRLKVSGLYASGDSDPLDDRANGFDSIVDEAFVAGGSLSYWNQQAIRLGGVNLVNAKSPFANLRPNKFEGQANFVNPGLYLVNAGLDADLLPKLRANLTVSYLGFAATDVLDHVLNQPAIGHAIGLDYGLGLQYRPFLNNQAILKLGAAALTPFAGFNDIYDSPGTQAMVFGSCTLTF
jgi:hypothetical protein